MHPYVLWFHVFTFYFKFCRGTGLFSHEFNLTHIFWSNRPEQKDIGSTWNKKRNVVWSQKYSHCGGAGAFTVFL